MRRTSRAALTLIEMLVAMAITLIMMGAVVTIFGTVGNSVSGSRATMEISERLRNARNVLQRDLGNITVTMLPPRRPESDEGYFEYVEGPQWDGFFPTGGVPGLRGDGDDYLGFTARSQGEPYVGRLGVLPGTTQSNTAEVIWYAMPNGLSIPDPSGGTPLQLLTLYRRVLLIAPSSTANTGVPITDFQIANDISAHPTGGTVGLNTLGDVTKRENRFSHDNTTGPHLLVPPTPFDAASGRLGEDVILTNVLAFDVKAYDRTVPLYYGDINGNGTLDANEPALVPSDQGYGTTAIAGATGGFVDLNYSSYQTGSSQFSGLGAQAALPGVYDTWSLHYEAGGIGLDGLDNGGTPGVVDDPSEMQFPPPYPHPLRGIQVKIRVYEPDSRQVREVTVVQDFLPQ